MNRPEERLQKLVVQYLNLAHPTLLHFAVPNQRGGRSLVENAILKTLGVRAGVADLCVVLPGSGKAAFIELKAPKGKLSESQVLFAQQAQGNGALWRLVRSLEDLQAVLADWGVPSRAAA